MPDPIYITPEQEQEFRAFAASSGQVRCLNPHAGLLSETCYVCGATV